MLYMAMSQKFLKLGRKQEFTDLPCNKQTDWYQKWSKKFLCSRVSPSNGEIEKEGENAISGTCQFCMQTKVCWVTVGVLDVKSLVEHNGEGWKS